MKRTPRHTGSSQASAKNINREKASAGPTLEGLEARQLLSGNVVASVTAGNLIILGDAADNTIVLDQAGLSAGQVRISGVSGTAINSQVTPVVINGVTGRVKIAMGDGVDKVAMNNLSLPGNLLVKGQQRLTLTNVHVGQLLNISSENNTRLTDTTVGTDLTILSASGGGNVALQAVNVQGNTRIVGGIASDTFTIDDSNFQGSVGLQTLLGNDIVQIEGHGDAMGSPTEFHGPVSVLLGANRDILQLGVTGQAGNHAVFARSVNLDGGVGFDTLAKANNTVFSRPLRVGIVNFEPNYLAQMPINLGAAAAFAVMATASINSTGTTQINGDVGLNPGSSQGIPPAQVNGTIHVDDPTIVAAQADLLAAYNDAVSRSVNSISLPGNLGGLTLTPGLYTNSTSVLIQGSGPGNNVTLDAQGDPNAIFIFKMGSTLTTGPGAQVILAGGAQASNIFWQVGTSATLGTTTIFKGNILAAVSITVNTGSVVRGRLLGGSNSNGSVTVNASRVLLPVA